MKSSIVRGIFGVPILGWGFAMIVVEMLRFWQQNVDVHLMHIFLGLVFMYIGGRIISSTLAESITNGLLEKAKPFISLIPIPGGRRRTDPPLEEPAPAPPPVEGDENGAH